MYFRIFRVFHDNTSGCWRSTSKYSNMNALRPTDGVWRIAFAFDPDRQAILLVGRDKSGGSEQRFYKSLIARADDRFDRHLERLKG